MNEETKAVIDSAPEYMQGFLTSMIENNGETLSERLKIFGGIRQQKLTPGNGFEYHATATALPYIGFQGGGNVDDYYILTLFAPEYSPSGISYVVMKNGYLTTDYIREKFDVANRMSDETLFFLTELAKSITSTENERW